MGFSLNSLADLERKRCLTDPSPTFSPTVHLLVANLLGRLFRRVFADPIRRISAKLFADFRRFLPIDFRADFSRLVPPTSPYET